MSIRADMLKVGDKVGFRRWVVERIAASDVLICATGRTTDGATFALSCKHSKFINVLRSSDGSQAAG